MKFKSTRELIRRVQYLVDSGRLNTSLDQTLKAARKELREAARKSRIQCPTT